MAGKKISKFGKVEIDDSGGSARDISVSVTSITMTRSNEEIEIGGFTQDKYYLNGRLDAPILIEGLFDDTATTGSHTVLSGISNSNTARTVTIAFGDNTSATTGDPEYEGEMILASYEVSGSLDSAMTFSAKLNPQSSTLPAWGTVA